MNIPIGVQVAGLPDINLLPWRSLREGKRRRKIGIMLLSFVVLILLGALGGRAYFFHQIQTLNLENQKLSTEMAKNQQENSEKSLFNTWREASFTERQRTHLFLKTLRAAEFFKIHLHSAELDFSGPEFFNFLGVTPVPNLKAWIDESTQKIVGKEIQLIEMRKAFDQVEFEAKVSWEDP